MAIQQIRSKLSTRATLRGNISVYRNRDINDVLPSQIVEQQFPEFIRDDYPKMVDFAKAYFSFLELTENGKIDDLKNLDKTSGEYIIRLRNEFAFNATKFNFLEDKEFIRYAKYFYSSKGTEESIKFLFRVMFDEPVEIDYPSERIFKPSTARWFQEQSVKVVIDQNSLPPTEFIGNYLQIRNSTGAEQTIEVSDVLDITEKVTENDPSTIFEIFFTTELLIPVSIGDVVFGTELSSTIIPSLSSLKIISPGSNFRIGQVINLDSITGSGAVAVITNVRDNGEIRNVKFLKFGKNYTTDFYLGISPEGVFTDSGTSFSTTGLADINKAIEDITEGFVEKQSILRSDYVLNNSPVTGASPFSNYVYSSYTGAYVSQSTNRQVFFLEEDYSALLLSRIGAVCKYPGKYLDQTGMASNSSVLQDNNVFQDFSYIVKTTSDIEEYKETITALAHPAGFKMFGELSVENVFDSDTNLLDVSNSSDLNVTYFDFLASDTLDRRITFTRASSATYFDSTGTLQTAAVNTGRVDYDPTTLVKKGLLVEEARTNVVRNNTIVGAVAGTPGTMPTNWTQFGTVTGLTRTVVGTGIEKGISYIDVKFTGTASAAGPVTIQFEASASALFTAGTTVTGSVWCARVGGSASNITSTSLRLMSYLSTTYLSERAVAMALTSTLSRFTNTYTTAATSDRISFAATINVAAAGAIDVTLRLGLPQLEQGDFATSVIPTTTTALTRSAEAAHVNGLSPWYNSEQYTLYYQGICDVFTSNQVFIGFGDTFDSATYISRTSPWMIGSVRNAATTQAQMLDTFTPTVGISFKTAIAVQNNNFAFCVNGRTPLTDTAGNTSSSILRLAIASSPWSSTGGTQGQQWVWRVEFHPLRLSNAALQALTL